MALKGLNYFVFFDLDEFLEKKKLVFLKSAPWISDGKELGSKVTVQIIEDGSTYSKPDISNFGEQLTIKVLNLQPSAFGKLQPLVTKVTVVDVEHAAIYGEYRNQLSIVASISVNGT